MKKNNPNLRLRPSRSCFFEGERLIFQGDKQDVCACAAKCERDVKINCKTPLRSCVSP